MPNAINDFGAQLRKARRAGGLSQADLSELCAIPKSRLSRYENGHILPSITTLQRLAEGLGVTEGDLLGTKSSVQYTFFQTLHQRNVRIRSHREAVRMAHTLADAVAPADA